jgi:transglutaminase-like putative cysteine protease
MRRVAVSGAVLALVFAIGQEGASEGARPLLDTDGDLVVLTGLPGDVESEKAYQDQLRRLLQPLASPDRRPRRLVALVDAPEAAGLPAALGAEVRPATRASLLELAGRLDRSRRLTVFVWGHGGHQGTQPVFHVRGPRVTPQDLVTLAGDGPSDWVLYFRGSGAFARALRGAGRAILASEHETAFRSDPVGFPLLLDVLESDPDTSLESLAERLGSRTAAWYAERRLARQEEPTLRRGDGPPRLLAQETGVRPTDAPVTAATTRAPSPAWKDVATVDAGRYPGADAVVLRSRTSYTLGDAPAVAVESDTFIQILSAEGKRHADFDVAYSPPFEELRFLDCEVLRPDGVVERLDASEIRDAGRGGLADYPGPARKLFSLPQATPGAILRVHVRREWKTFPLPHVFLEVPIGGGEPVLNATVEIRVPARSAFHHSFRHLTPRAPTVSETRYGRVYSWSFDDLPPVVDEPLTPPGLHPSLLISTFPDWAAFASWYAGLIREADRVTPEIAAKAAELTRAARTVREKVAAVYDYVTGLRYVALPLGVNSHRPHAAGSVLRNQYGDCKDKANLFNTLLRSLDIPADLVLVPRFTQADEATPGLAFNHAISRVRVGGETLWLDTTDDVARFGVLPPGDPGRKVLVVDGGTTLTELPRPDPAAHTLTLRARLDPPGGDDGALPAALELTATGHADYALRGAVRQAGGSAPVLAEALAPSHGYFALTEQRSTPAGALDQAFTWRATGSLHGLVTPLPGEARLLRGAFWLPREWELALHPRRSPLFLNQGHPLRFRQEIDVRLPAEPDSLPPPRRNDRPPLRWRLEWTKEAATVRGVLELELTTGEPTAEETRDFQSQLRGLIAALTAGPTYRDRRGG